MPVSMFEFSVPVFVRTLRNLRAVLEIGEKFAGEKGIAPDVLLQTRLIPDMLPLVRQVQIATDMAKNGSARLTATEPMPFPDEEATFGELYARIDRCIGYLEGFKAPQFEGTWAFVLEPIGTTGTSINTSGPPSMSFGSTTE